MLTLVLPLDKSRVFKQIGSAVGLVLAVSCGAPQMSPTPKPAASPLPTAPVEQVEPQRQALHERLSQLPRQPSPLSAVPKDLAGALERRVAGLDVQVKQALLDPAAVELAASRPLLHLMAGGQDLKAYTALFSTAAAANELVELRLAAASGDPTGDGSNATPIVVSDLIAAVNRIAELAAVHVLRQRAVDVAPSKEPTRDTLQQIAVAAQVASEIVVEGLALERLAALDPGAERDRQLASFFSRALKPSEAQPYAQRLSAAGVTDADKVLQLVTASRRVVDHPQPTGRQEVLDTARAWLTLGKSEQALALVGAQSSLFGKDLALATTYVRSLASDAACPLLDSVLGNAYLCAEGWRQVRSRHDPVRLADAWRSGEGRDAQAVEDYLGIVHVVPMTYGASAIGANEAPADLLQVLAQMEADSRDAAGLAPHFLGVAALAQALRVAVEASSQAAPGARPILPPEQRRAFLNQVSELKRKLGSAYWGQSAAFGLLAMVTPDENVREPLALFEKEVLDELAAPYNALLLWQLLADGDIEEFVRAKQRLGATIDAVAEGGFERAKWLMLWAEAEAHLRPGEPSFAMVESLSARLSLPEVPLSLRLRAAVNLAGVQARQGSLANALSDLEPIVQATPRGAVSNRSEQELLIAATGYMFILRALTSQGDSRGQPVKELANFLTGVSRARAAAPSLQLWLRRWLLELEYQERRRGCRGNLRCETAAAKARVIPSAEQHQAIGSRTTKLLEKGVLTVGGVEIKFSYQSNGRLRPQLMVDSRFLLAHSPQGAKL